MKPVNCVKFDAVRAEFGRQYIGKGDTDPTKVQAAKRQAAHRALEAAERDNIINIRDDWCWLIT